MKLKGAAPVIVLGLLLSVSASVTQAQVTKEQLDAAGAALAAPRAFFSQLPEQQRQRLSGAALNFFHMATHWSDLEARVLATQGILASGSPRDLSLSSPGTAPNPDIKTTSGPVPVSNPATDFVYGPPGGFTQNTTSTAWCGANVVVGFNDSGSYWESALATGFSNISYIGWALSTNEGLSFTDKTYLPAATANPYNDLEGEPVVACSNASTFYYASLFYTYTGSSDLTAVSVSKSTDGGSTFGAPVFAVSKDASIHYLDKDSMAINPANPSQIAVTYTDEDYSGTICGSGVWRYGIELVYSLNGGATWSSPQVVYTACDASPDYPWVTGSQVAFSPSGAVNVAFELYSYGLPTDRQIEFEQAPSLGAAFGSTVAVQDVTYVGYYGTLQGGFDTPFDIGGMAVDNSTKATKGNIYIVYQSSDFTVEFPPSCSPGCVIYNYSDVWITKSTNNGSTWSTPLQVNTNTEPLPSGLGTDSYQPGVVVDNTSGHVGVCWYDRRNDPVNYKVDRYCGHSTNAGASFTNSKMTTRSFEPIHDTDFFYMGLGDYDGVASDVLKTTPGFIGAFSVVTPASTSCPTLPCVLVPSQDVVSRNFN
jgi:hypothetical protein